MADEQTSAGLTREQKIGFVLLFVFAVFAIGLGFLQIRNSLYAPFALNKSVPPIASDSINTPEALAYRDTDQDGLSDFDELYVYQTSAYLPDTDSDGMGDKEEIEQGKNPVCPEGKDCSEFSAEETGVVSATTTIATSSQTLPVGFGELEKILGSPAEIRKLLLKSGIDKKVLDQTSDTELLQLVREVLTNTSTFNVREQ